MTKQVETIDEKRLIRALASMIHDIAAHDGLYACVEDVLDDIGIYYKQAGETNG